MTTPTDSERSQAYRDYLDSEPGERVHYTDLLGVKHRKSGRDKSGMDCTGVCAEIMRRVGFCVPESAWSLHWDASGEELVLPDCWETLGTTWAAADRVGDIIASDPNGIGAAEHVSVMVSPKHFSTLTSTHRIGVIVARAYTIKNVIGVYRFCP